MSVKPGGLFGAQPKAQYSKETADLLKLMMEESKLTNYQQRVLKDSVKGGGSLPLRVNPNHSKDGPSARSKKKPKAHSPKHSGLKSKQTIDLEIANNPIEPYKPAPSSYNSEKEKERLNQILIFGTDKPLPKPEPKYKPKAPKDRFTEIEYEIEERRQFLAEMEALGRGKDFKHQIETEISQYIREMEVIDKKQNKALQSLRDELEKEEMPDGE